MSKEKSSKGARKGGPPIVHDQPIILDNASITLGIDGTPPSYVQISPAHYRAAGHRITSVIIDGTPCNGVPGHGMCTIEILGKHDTAGDDSPVRIVGDATGIDIRFNGAHYQKISSGNRKVHKSNVRRVRRLTIRDDRTGGVHVCSLPSPQNSYQIVIRDNV